MSFTGSEKYTEAVQNPQVAFSDNDLKHCRVESVLVLGSLLPKPYSGGFTTTFRLSNKNNSWAVRCFTREVNDIQNRYKVIGDFISKNNSIYFVDAKFLNNGVNVYGIQYPIIKMQWIDGELLNTYINRIYNQKTKVEKLLTDFVSLVYELEGLGIAHGDLQHGNIIVKNEKLYLIDYDGMFFPELSSLKTVEVGHPNFQHLERTPAHFNNKMDRFSAITIYLGLKAVSHDPNLWNIYNNGDNILFLSKDFQNPHQSALINQLLAIQDLKELTKRFIGVCNLEFNEIPSLKDYISGNFNYSLVQKKAQSFSAPNKNHPINPTEKESEIFNILYENKPTSPQQITPTYSKKGSYAWLWSLLILFVIFIFLKALIPITKNPTSLDDNKIYNYLEKHPKYNGGESALMEYLKTNLSYPRNAILNKTSGTVYTSFIINKDGSISDIEITKDIGDGCGNEALRLIRNMPNWIPGYLNNKPKRSRNYLSVTFTLPIQVTTNCNYCNGSGFINQIFTCPYCHGSGFKDCSYCSGKKTINCIHCFGNGTYECSSCSGIGSSTCSYCGGGAYINCIDCGGLGYSTCKNCKGDGKISDDIYGTYTCSRCEGTGKLLCKTCKGYKKIKCSHCKDGKIFFCNYCKGKGTLICNYCKGSGNINCKYCNGSGGEHSKCETCNGTGKIQKKIKCSHCKGTQ